MPATLHPRVQHRLENFIQAHLHEEIDLDALASVANVSRFHFARAFRASKGSSAMAYLEQRRIERAQDLIRSGEATLAQVASLVGYGDPSYFTRRFRLRTGLTPSAWARLVGKKEESQPV